MKKLLLTILAMATLVGCSKDETLDVQTRSAITFEDAFVDNAVSTRAPIDNSYKDISSFEVYGTITNNSNESANIFLEEKVSKTGNVWGYDEANTQYWIPGNTYSFRAFVDGDEAGATGISTDQYGMPTALTVHDVSAQKDVLFAESMGIEYEAGDNVNPVKFVFEHLMAKAHFTVWNTITTNSGYSYKVKKIVVSAPKTAVYTIGKGWGEAKYSCELEFGNITDEPIHTSESEDASLIGYQEKKKSAFERLLIPTQVMEPETKSKFNMKFVRELYKRDDMSGKDVLIHSEVVNLTSKANLKAGHAYNFVIKLGNPGEPIEFSVESIKGWTPNPAEETTMN